MDLTRASSYLSGVDGYDDKLGEDYTSLQIQRQGVSLARDARQLCFVDVIAPERRTRCLTLASATTARTCDEVSG